MGALVHLPWKLIPFLFSLFVIMGWFDNIGMVDFIANALIQIESEWTAAFVVGLGSTALAQFINNQPMTVLVASVLSKVEDLTADAPPHWMDQSYFALTAAANLGGNGTIIASLAVILWRQILSEHDVKINYTEFAKRGLSITALSVIVCIVAQQTTMMILGESSNQSVDPSTFCKFRHPQYPYHGGGACSASCLNDEYRSPSWDLRRRHYPNSFSSEFAASYEMAAGILMESGLDVGHGPFVGDEPRPSIDYNLDDVHMTLDYFCCYDPFETKAIMETAESFNWTATEITFDRLICTVNYDQNTFPGPNNIELMVMADEQSNQRLMGMIGEFEQKMAAQGIVVNVARRDNIGFHVTLAHVDQTKMNLNAVVERINQQIDWSTITMTMFDGGHVLNGWPEDMDVH